MEQQSMDILDCWPSTVLDLIFQHLTGKEIIAATLVSQRWNDFLSTSSLTAWKDITIQPKISEELDALVNSNRRFEHIRGVNFSAILPQFMEIVRKPGRKWRTIKIFRQEFVDESQVLEILQISAKTIEELELHSISRKQQTETNLPIPTSFPALKILRISYHLLDVSLPWFHKFIKSTPQLESIHIANGCDIHMKNLILASEKLKKLSLSGRFLDKNFFCEVARQMPSRLEEFEFNDILSSSDSDENLSYFNHFFKSQSKTLRKFETDALLELNEFETAFAMPNLVSLQIKSFHYNRDMIDPYLDSLRRSTEITAASLKFLTVQLMDQKLLELLAINAGNLEYLRSDELTATDASNPRWFPKLEKFQVLFLSQTLESKINEKPENERSHLEKLIISGIVPLDIAIHLSHGEIAREIIDAIEG